jgi:hypothetical protein
MSKRDGSNFRAQAASRKIVMTKKREVVQLRDASAGLEAKVAGSNHTVPPSIFKNDSEAFIVLIFVSMRQWVPVNGSDTLEGKSVDSTRLVIYGRHRRSY